MQYTIIIDKHPFLAAAEIKTFLKRRKTMNKRTFALFLVLVMVLTMLPVTALALEDTEPNDTLPTAQEFALCDTINGTIGAKKEVDWYKFTLAASGKVTFKMTSYMDAYSMWLFDADGGELSEKWSKQADASTGMRTDSYVFHLTEGTYYILVSGEYNEGNSWNEYATGSYTIKTDYVNANATEKEDNDNIAQAEALPLFGSVMGQIALTDKNDFFKIELPASGKLVLDMDAYLSYHCIVLFNEDGDELWAKNNVQWDASAGKHHGSYSMHLIAGTYYIKVTGEYNRGNSWNEFAYGNYTLTTDFVNANANEVEPNDNLVQAQWVSPNKTYNGQIALNDKYDFFQFTLTREMDLTIDITAYLSYHSLFLFNEDGDEIWAKQNIRRDDSAGEQHGSYVVHLAPGTYTLKITGEYNRGNAWNEFAYGNYTFHLNTENPFSDVPADAFYYTSVLWAVEKGITTGIDATHFVPDGICTRGQIVTFLWRAAGSPAPESAANPFGDVKPEDFYYKAVLWAVEKGITKGTSDTTFSPDEPCTRGQVVTFLWRALGEAQPGTDGNPFGDVPAEQYYYNAVLWAVEKNITKGTSETTFSPDEPCTRGQIVTFLYRALA